MNKEFMDTLLKYVHFTNGDRCNAGLTGYNHGEDKCPIIKMIMTSNFKFMIKKPFFEKIKLVAENQSHLKKLAYFCGTFLQLHDIKRILFESQNSNIFNKGHYKMLREITRNADADNSLMLYLDISTPDKYKFDTDEEDYIFPYKSEFGCFIGKEVATDIRNQDSKGAAGVFSMYASYAFIEFLEKPEHDKSYEIITSQKILSAAMMLL